MNMYWLETRWAWGTRAEFMLQDMEVSYDLAGFCEDEENAEFKNALFYVETELSAAELEAKIYASDPAPEWIRLSDADILEVDAGI